MPRPALMRAALPGGALDWASALVDSMDARAMKLANRNIGCLRRSWSFEFSESLPEGTALTAVAHNPLRLRTAMQHDARRGVASLYT